MRRNLLLIWSLLLAPLASSILFESDWSTGIGNDSLVLRDTSQAIPWNYLVDGGAPNIEVVAANTAALVNGGVNLSERGWPTENALKSTYTDPPSSGVVGVSGTSSPWLEPEVGQYLYHRWYWLHDGDDALGGGTFPGSHSPQAAPGGICPSVWNYGFSSLGATNDLPRSSTPEANGQYFVSILSSVSGTFQNDLMAPLTKGDVYRWELRIKRETTDQIQLSVRVYDAAGVLLYSNADFLTKLSGSSQGYTLSSSPNFAYPATHQAQQCLRGVMVGVGGTSPIAQGTVTYTGAWATRLANTSDEWIGPYASDSSPAVCGNGIVENNEDCDNAGSNGVCPALCNATCSNNVCQPGDTTPPIATITVPTAAQVLPTSTTQTTLAVNTNEAATCKYGASDTHSYAQMPNTMTGAGSTSHTATISSLVNAGTYSYYVRCNDTAGNAMMTSQSVSFTVADTQERTIIFESDWRTAQGSSTAAQSDGGKWTVSNGGSRDRLTIVSNTGIGFPTRNVVRMEYNGSSYALGKIILDREIAVGETLYRRIYWRYNLPSGPNPGSSNHPLESTHDPVINSVRPLAWEMTNSVEGAPFNARWLMSYDNMGTYADRAHRWRATFEPDTTYRIEWAMTRFPDEDGNARWRLQSRVYTADGQLLYDDADFTCTNYGHDNHNLATTGEGPNSWTTAGQRTLAISGTSIGYQGGYNYPGEYLYWGGFAACQGDWCGAYQGMHRVGDLNTDGVVDLQDVIQIVANFRRRGNYDEGADINSDSYVNVLDMVLLAREWG